MGSVGPGRFFRPTRVRRWRWLAIRVLLLLGCQGLLAAESAQPPASTVVARMRDNALAITYRIGDYDRLLASIGDASIVPLGESTHGSAKFYDERARITQRLIDEKGCPAAARSTPLCYGRDVANGAMPSCARQVRSRLTKMRQLAGPAPAPAAPCRSAPTVEKKLSWQSFLPLSCSK